MKIYTEGSRHWGGQVDRIDQGFQQLGHEVIKTISDADLVYINNPWFDQIIEDKRLGRIRGNIVMNVLDVPVHLKEYDPAKLAAQLRHADAITSISQFTNGTLQRYCGLDSYTIYNPIKPVHQEPELTEKPFFKFAHIGRRYDPNKRAAQAFAALQILGFTERDICLVGNEGGWGTYLGVLNDQNLNIVYNSVQFVLCTSEIEGLCLPVVEAMACGAIPVVCKDLTTREELLPSNIFPEYLGVDGSNPVTISRFIEKFLNSPASMTEFRYRLYYHYSNNLARKMSGLGVAESILKVYDRL
jgi:glycosyltransferase involved in cell wall biosynthesis